MKANNASTSLLSFQKRIEQLLREAEDFEQMKADVKEYTRFRELLVHEPND